MPRRKRGEIREFILDALSKVYPNSLKFSLIKKRVEKRSKSRIKLSNKVVYENLNKLREEGQAERVKEGWRLTSSYTRARARELLGKITRESLPVNISYAGHSLTQYFELGYCRRISDKLDPPLGLDKVAIERFCLEVKERLSSMSEEERNLILGFAARSLWLGFKFFSRYPIPGKPQFKSLSELVLTKIDTEVGRHYLVEYMFQGLRDTLDGSHLPAVYKMLLLAYGLLEPLCQDFSATIETVPASEKINSKWLYRRRKKFRAFLGNIDKIRFAYVVAVGFEDLQEKELIKLSVLNRFERWFESLREGRYLMPSDFLTGELKSVEEAMKNTEYRLEHGLPPRKNMSFPTLGWTPQDLYTNHPRGKDPKFYSEIGETVRKAIAGLSEGRHKEKPID